MNSRIVVYEKTYIMDVATLNTIPIQVSIPSSNEEVRSTSSLPPYFTGCYGLPYQDHNYGAPPPAHSPPPTPARVQKQRYSEPQRYNNNDPPRLIDHAGRIADSYNKKYHHDTIAAFTEPLANDVASEVVYDHCDPVGDHESEDVDDSVTRCACEFAHDDGYMICCDRCSVWQHIDCMGIDRNAIPDTYYCERCQPRYIDKKRAIEMQKWKREELLKLALAQGNPTDLKKLGVNARKIMAFKQRHGSTHTKKVKEKIPHKTFRRKTVDVVPKQRKNKVQKSQEPPARMKSLENENHRNSTFVEAECNDYTAEVRDALAREKNHRLCDTVDTVLFIKLLAQLRNNSYLYSRAGSKGLVACENIFCNQPIIEYRGKVMLKDQCEKPAVALKQRHTHILYYGRVNHLEVCVDASHYGNEARYIRRSCTPNAEVRHVINGERIHFIVYSRGDIERGAEITIPFDFNYRESNHLVECACTLWDCPVVKFIDTIASTTTTTTTGSSSSSSKTNSSSSKKENAQPGSGNVQPAPVGTRRKSSSAASSEPAVKKRRKSALTSPERNNKTPVSKHSPVKESQPDKEPPSALQQNGTSEDNHDKRKQTREERKLEAIMRAFENMEKKRQGRRGKVPRSEHPVICTKRDDDITPEFANESPDRSLLSPIKPSPAQSPNTEHKPKLPSRLESRSESESECKSIDIDVTSIETKEEVKSEVVSPISSPKKEVEQDYRHFLDTISDQTSPRLDVGKSPRRDSGKDEVTSPKLEVVERSPPGQRTPKPESGTDSDAGGPPKPAPMTPGSGAECSGNESTPCPSSEPETQQSPPKRKGWRRRQTLSGRRNNRVRSMNDMTPPTPPSGGGGGGATQPSSPVHSEPAFVHKTKKAINETLSEPSIVEEDALQKRLASEEQVFIKLTPHSGNLAHLRRSSAGGVRGSDASSTYSTKKRWLKQAMTEDPGPAPMLPPPSATPSPDTAPGPGPVFPPPASCPGPTADHQQQQPQQQSCNNSIVTTPDTYYTPLKKRRLARESLLEESDSRESPSLSTPASPLVVGVPSQPTTPTPLLMGVASHPTTPSPLGHLPYPGFTDSGSRTTGPTDTTTAAVSQPVIVIGETDEPVTVNRKTGTEPVPVTSTSADNRVQPCSTDNTCNDDTLPDSSDQTPHTPHPENVVYRPTTPEGSPPHPGPPLNDSAISTTTTQSRDTSASLSGLYDVTDDSAISSSNDKVEDVEEGEIIEDEMKMGEKLQRDHEEMEEGGTSAPEVYDDTDKLISEIDAKLMDLEQRIGGGRASPPPPPPPPRLMASPMGGFVPRLAGIPVSGMVAVPVAVPVPVPLSPVNVYTPAGPSPTMKRKVSLADYRRRRQTSTGSGSSTARADSTSSSGGSPTTSFDRNDRVMTSSPAVTSAVTSSAVSLQPLPLFNQVTTGAADPPPRKFSEPTLAERIAERFEHKAITSHLDRPKVSLSERLKSEFGVELNASFSDD